MDGRTYGHFPPLILLGRLLEVDLKIGDMTKQIWRAGTDTDVQVDCNRNMFVTTSKHTANTAKQQSSDFDTTRLMVCCPSKSIKKLVKDQWISVVNSL